jgi:hypothetical protein
MCMRKRSVALLVTILLGVGGCSENQRPSSLLEEGESESSSQNTFASPDGCFKTAKNAILTADYAGFCNCWTPEGRDLVACGFVFTAGLYKHMAQSENKEDNVQRLTEVLEKHGLTEGTGGAIHLTGDKEADRKEALKLVEPIEDRTAFIVDMLTLIPIISERPNAKLIQEDAHLVDLSITGDSATAKLVQTREGETLESPITFIHVNGEWKIDEVERLMN